jgi:hypothetical protein
MAQYIEFPTTNGPVLVEVDRDEILPEGEVTKAGLRDLLKRDRVAEAKTNFETALETSVAANASALTSAIDRLERRPAEVELAFGLKATGQLGNIAIAKISGEASFKVRILWTRSGHYTGAVQEEADASETSASDLQKIEPKEEGTSQGADYG